jgi:hypothetical protein
MPVIPFGIADALPLAIARPTVAAQANKTIFAFMMSPPHKGRVSMRNTAESCTVPMHDIDLMVMNNHSRQVDAQVLSRP